jgi:AraC family transcriptional regulator
MADANSVFLVNKFPDFNIEGFNMDTYNQAFKQTNIIINAFSADVGYPEHWGCLSIKCAFGGNEVYRFGDRQYSVNGDSWFICNDGEYYSSYIAARQPVESFTMNFSQGFIRSVAQSLLAAADHLLDSPDFLKDRPIEFVQKLYRHEGALSNTIFGLRELTGSFGENKHLVEEQYYALATGLFLSQRETLKEITRVSAVKLTTQRELYKRLHYAKDYIESCYPENITLDQLACIACLNTAYFLREFKKLFGQTPYQYLIAKRISVAKHLLLITSIAVTEICFAVGYADVSSFCKLFKKTCLLSPDNYRQLHKKVIFHT